MGSDVEGEVHDAAVTGLGLRPLLDALNRKHRRYTQALPDYAIALGKGGQPLERCLLGVRLDLNGNHDVLHADWGRSIDP